MSRASLPPFFSSWLDRSSKECMYVPTQLQLFTIANLTGGGGTWIVADYIHFSEVGFRKSFDGLGVIDLEIPKFADLPDPQKK